MKMTDDDDLSSPRKCGATITPINDDLGVLLNRSSGFNPLAHLIAAINENTRQSSKEYEKKDADDYLKSLLPGDKNRTEREGGGGEEHSKHKSKRLAHSFSDPFNVRTSRDFWLGSSASKGYSNVILNFLNLIEIMETEDWDSLPHISELMTKDRLEHDTMNALIKNRRKRHRKMEHLKDESSLELLKLSPSMSPSCKSPMFSSSSKSYSSISSNSSSFSSVSSSSSSSSRDYGDSEGEDDGYYYSSNYDKIKRCKPYSKQMEKMDYQQIFRLISMYLGLHEPRNGRRKRLLFHHC